MLIVKLLKCIMNILIVEDNKEMLDSLELLFKDEGFVVDTAQDGDEGFHKANNNCYDIIVLDICLPFKDGMEVCREIRSLGISVPIIMLSVNGDLETKVNLLKIGADDYVTKPFFFAELLARVGALLRRPRKVENAIFEIDDLIIDLDGHTVRRGNKDIWLTMKEFLLLEYLIKNRGRVLSRTEILEHVWDMNANPLTNTIETHITNLRKKIGFRGNGKFIRTVSGVGYKID